ncbi:SH3 domain-containing protein [Dyadobacter chenwenxiniae]|uniref:SH3 domain-containing protein n=2 Tax=Dyadobacter chenwenxiniae TaxID=2906456 RepID=A0A9X1PQI6_9BACT|nr:SH3 domain-containing protein [Dyadobacter chenwenxiniae]MCF0050649.1 SH3 domain-containing protein [Dyadobacter chenwenxiniae]MCF0065086.1 SH3 domain-containing protein [Dyadobacter chenwenxiniae]UON84642.1 SH3 domain-containing protein [Dyadobacter chenwenxiniae]
MADSLFAMARYPESLVLYKKNFSEDEKNNQSLLLKLAFLAEKTNNYTDCLFYLSKVALTNPSRRLFEKMDKLAAEQNLTGYEFDDYNYFIIFYRRYGDYIPILLLTLGTYIVVIMVTKVRRGEPILQIHKVSIVVYLLVLLGILNVPSLYRTCIIVNENTFLRDEPSSAAAVIDRVGKGHKLTIVGSVDHWNRVIWNNQIVYIRKSDLWNI